MNSWEKYQAFLAGLAEWHREIWEETETLTFQMWYETPPVERVTVGGITAVDLMPGLQCSRWSQRFSTWPYEQCPRAAGQSTVHLGVGLCGAHGGQRNRAAVQGAVMAAHAFAEELNVSPWEALSSQVRLLGGQVEWLRQRVLEAEAKEGDVAISASGSARYWVDLLEQRGDRLAKVAKMAIDAGVAERVVRQVELEGELMFRAASAALSAADLSEETQQYVLSLMARQMLELESGEQV